MMLGSKEQKEDMLICCTDAVVQLAAACPVASVA